MLFFVLIHYSILMHSHYSILMHIHLCTFIVLFLCIFIMLFSCMFTMLFSCIFIILFSCIFTIAFSCAYSLVLVFRVGHQSLDLTIVQVLNGMYHILASHSDPKTGGHLIDDFVVEYFANEFQRYGRYVLASRATPHKTSVCWFRK